MGPTGSGKSNVRAYTSSSRSVLRHHGNSQFAEIVTGTTGLTSNSLEPFTREIVELQVDSQEFESSEIWLVDTPGLNSTNDMEVLRMLSEWLVRQYVRSDIKGVLFSHHQTFILQLQR